MFPCWPILRYPSETLFVRLPWLPLLYGQRLSTHPGPVSSSFRISVQTDMPLPPCYVSRSALNRILDELPLFNSLHGDQIPTRRLIALFSVFRPWSALHRVQVTRAGCICRCKEYKNHISTSEQTALFLTRAQCVVDAICRARRRKRVIVGTKTISIASKSQAFHGTWSEWGRVVRRRIQLFWMRV